jgi:hypothetical protein
MGRALTLTCFCLVTSLAAASEDAKPDFSGNWTLNLDRSSFGRGAKPDGMSLKVTRDGDVMHAVQTTNSVGGPTDIKSDWIVDGKEHDTDSATPGKVTTKWEGNILYSERRANDASLVQRIWLILSSDGKTATEKVWTKGAGGTNESRLIWMRQ